jgi:lipopolysaccharide export system permease protein
VPVSFFILTLLAVSVSSRKSRGGTGFHLGVGIFLMFMYLLLIQIFNTTGNTGVINPGFAVWIPPSVFLVISLILARNAPK